MLTLQEAADFFAASAARCEEELSGIVTAVVTDAAVRARGYIGNYQEGWLMGWERLSSATLYGFQHPSGGWIFGKEDLGYSPPDNPLLREGDMRDSIEFRSEGMFGETGSDSKIALYQEMGTPGALYPIPPRPFIAKGMMEAAYELEPLAETVAMSLLVP